jgi:hypothetical protein
MNVVEVLEEMNFGSYRNFERFMFSNDLKGFFDLAFFSFLVCSDGY